MAISVLLNGVTYSIPQTAEESWGSNVTNYLVAIPQGVLQKSGGNFTLTANVNFGASFGLLAAYLSTRAANPSTAGLVRLAVADTIGWRNNANNGNLLLAVNGSDQLTFNGSAVYPGGITALTGDVTATGPGSVAATITPGIIVNAMVNASAAIAYSKLNLASSIVNADISASAAIAFSKLAALTSANILVGNVSNVAASVAMSGDITIDNAGVTAIGSNKVTLGMMAQMATASFLGRNTASTGNVEVLSATTATAILNAMVGDSGAGGTKGLVPAPASGDAAASKFLKADGSWATVGTPSPLTTKGDIYTYTTTNARHGVPGDYGSMVPDVGQSDNWRNATYTQLNAKPGKNYIQYADFENNATTGWTGTGCATVTNGLPVSVGSGGAAFSSSNGGRALGGNTSAPAIDSSSAIAGTYCLNLATTGAGTIGDGYISSAYTIDPADQAKVLSFKVYYKSASGAPVMAGTSSNTYAIAIYDIVNNAWLGVAGGFNFVQSSGIGIAQGTFQTASNTTGIQIFIYSPVAPVGASSLLIDDVYVGPQVMAFGPPMSDWKAYTPTITAFGTATNVAAFWRRVGDSVEVQGSFTSGTTTAALGTITLPSGLVIDSAKLSIANTSANAGPIVGRFGQNAAANQSGMLVTATGTSTSLIYVAGNTTASLITAPANANVHADNQSLAFTFIVPISGWSSNTVMSADSNTRIIAARIGGDPASASAGNPIIFPTVAYDTAGGYNASTGRYTAQVTGYYRVHGFISSSATGGTFIRVYVNAALVVQAGQLDASGDCSYTATVQVNAGDLIDIRPDATVDANSNSTIHFEMLNGPAVVAASEKIYLQYTGNAGTALTANTTNVDFATKVVDSHNAWSGTSFTASVPGFYNVMGAVKTTAGVGATFYIYKNTVKNVQFSTVAGSQSYFHGCAGIYLLAGDAITVRSDTSATLLNSATDHWISITSQ